MGPSSSNIFPSGSDPVDGEELFHSDAKMQLNSHEQSTQKEATQKRQQLEK
jgi:hypothetical protein